MLGTLALMWRPPQSLDDLSAEQLREMSTRLLAELVTALPQGAAAQSQPG